MVFTELIGKEEDEGLRVCQGEKDGASTVVRGTNCNRKSYEQRYKVRGKSKGEDDEVMTDKRMMEKKMAATKKCAFEFSCCNVITEE